MWRLYIPQSHTQLTRLQTVHVRLAPDSGCRQVCECPMASGCGLPPHIYIWKEWQQQDRDISASPGIAGC